MITDWLDKYGDPQIEKKVMERLEKITKDQRTGNKISE